MTRWKIGHFLCIIRYNWILEIAKNYIWVKVIGHTVSKHFQPPKVFVSDKVVGVKIIRTLHRFLTRV